MIKKSRRNPKITGFKKVLGRKDYRVKEYILMKKNKTEVLTYFDFTYQG